MKKYTHSIKSLFSFIISLVLLIFHSLIFGYIWYTHYNPQLITPYTGKGNYLVIAIFASILYLFNLVFGGLKIGHYKHRDCIVAQTLSLLMTYFFQFFVISLLAYKFVSALYILYALLVGLIFNIAWTFIGGVIYKFFNPPRQILMVYGESAIDEIFEKISSREDKYNIVNKISYQIGEEQLKSEISNYDAVILYDLSANLRNHLIKYCYDKSIRVYITPKLYDILVRGASEIDLFDTPFLLMSNKGIIGFNRKIKRSADVVVSFLCIILLSPLLLLISLVVKCCDGGPVFYSQNRLTIGGKQFKILKFRSMYTNAEASAIRLQSKNDARITPVGKLLRKTHLDELPQLFNILTGDMSLVGPRPERPEIAAIYEESIPEFTYRLKVKAGLTGYAQVYGNYNSTPYDKLKLDLMYIEHYSLLLDIKLLLLTGKTLFIPDHAEGISEKYMTALREKSLTPEDQSIDKDINNMI